MMLDVLLGLVLVLAVAIVAVPNVLGPIVIWRSQRLPAQVEFRALPQPQFLAQRNAEFHRYHGEMLALDFELCGSTTLGGPNATTYFSLYVHESTRMGGAVISAENSAGHSVTYAEVTDEYEDGSLLTVSNSSQAGAFPRIAWKHMFQFEEVTDVAEIIRRHARIRERILPRATPKPVRREDAWRVLSEFTRRESDELVNLGFCHPEMAPDGHRRLTFWGACRMTWKLAIPGIWLSRFAIRRRARRALGS